MTDLICVDPKRINDVWPYAKPILEKAYARQRGDTTLESCEVYLRTGDSLLWLAWDGAKFVAACTTRLIETARERLCVIEAYAGAPVWDEHLAAIEDFAKAEGCAAIRISGRRGWARVFPHYVEPFVVLEKRF